MICKNFNTSEKEKLYILPANKCIPIIHELKKNKTRNLTILSICPLYREGKNINSKINGRGVCLAVFGAHRGELFVIGT